jgi:hypothetical protein
LSYSKTDYLQSSLQICFFDSCFDRQISVIEIF